MKKLIAGLIFGITFLTDCNQDKVAFVQGFMTGAGGGFLMPLMTQK